MSHIIAKYDDKLKTCFHLKTKPEPWMHLVVSISNADKGLMQVLVAVYVWDTRTIIESQQHTEMPNILRKQLACLNTAVKPIDNRIELNGPGADVLNAELHWKQATTESLQPAVEAFTHEQLANVYDKCYSKCKGYVLDIASAMHECLLDWAKEHDSKASVVNVNDVVALVRDALNSPDGAIARGAKR